MEKEIKKPISVVVTIPTSSYFNSGLRELSRTLAEQMAGFSQQWAYRFQSVVDELVNNAIEFGSKPGENIEIKFITLLNQYAEVFVKDTGTGKRGKNAHEIREFIETQKKVHPSTIGMRGRGLSQIVSKWVDKMEFTDNPNSGITAHVVKYLQQDETLVIPV